MSAGVVIGVGNDFRRDDGVGLAVARQLRDVPGCWPVHELDGEPSRVVDAWTGAPVAVVVDAVCTGADPGSLQVLEVGRDDLPTGPVHGSTHGLGVAEAVRLGSVLGRLPDRVVVVGVEGADFGEGPGLTAAVAAAVPEAARRVLAVVGGRDDATVAVRVAIAGVVQGVGFRPFVWRLARRCGLRGWVRNDGGCVTVHAEGPAEAVERLVQGLRHEAPPRARVERVQVRAVAPEQPADFAVAPSRALVAPDAGGPADRARQVAPDATPCPACLRELADPTDRRYRYPFLNCTDCGPRFTVIEELPYDRERTTMRSFPLCAACAAEYADPADRRFHAEPVACPACGPSARLLDAQGATRQADDPVEAAAELLAAGAIVAVKGLGGFHLACDATDERAVAELRRRKHRPDKPLAVAVADLADARRWFSPTPTEVALLAGPAGPIVLVRPAAAPVGPPLAAGLAPGHRRVGVMLAPTPLHHLLASAVGRPLVMTSGNRADEPIAVDDAEATAALAGVADAYLTHDRPIAARYDDSVALVRGGRPALLRRARGHAPAPVALAVDVPPLLATGAELQATFCLAAGRSAFVSAHVGDLDDAATLDAYQRALDRLGRLTGITPEVVAHDLHPDLATTALAGELGLPTVAVQHHHAHVAAVAAEHGLTGAVLGVAYDGFGLGTDDTAWGGELLACDGAAMERVGHLGTVALPGGDVSVRHPARMALVHAAAAGRLEPALALLGLTEDRSSPLLAGATPALVLAQAAAGAAAGAPATSSVGRLLDALSALAGVCRRPSYEGQTAMLFEQVACDGAADPYPVSVVEADGRLVIDPSPLVAGAVDDLVAGAPPGRVAARAHAWLVEATVTAVHSAAAAHGLDRVCLGGGVFANDLLAGGVVRGLTAQGLAVYLPEQVPAGDGGLSLGQALVAGAVVGDGG